jgi:hypothetical protein
MQLARLAGLLAKLGGLLFAFKKVIFILPHLPVGAGHDPALIGPADRISSVLSWFLFYNLWRPSHEFLRERHNCLKEISSGRYPVV